MGFWLASGIGTPYTTTNNVTIVDNFGRLGNFVTQKLIAGSGLIYAYAYKTCSAETYEYTVWARALSHTSTSAQLAIQNDSDPWPDYGYLDVTLTSKWQKFTFTGVIPSGGLVVRAIIRYITAGHSIEVAGLEFEPGTTARDEVYLEKETVIKNSEFLTQGDWILGTNWSISNGTLIATNVNQYTQARQMCNFKAGVTYNFKIVVSSAVPKRVDFRITRHSDNQYVLQQLSTGVNEFSLTPNYDSDECGFSPDDVGTTNITIDSIYCYAHDLNYIQIDFTQEEWVPRIITVFPQFNGLDKNYHFFLATSDDKFVADTHYWGCVAHSPSGSNLITEMTTFGSATTNYIDAVVLSSTNFAKYTYDAFDYKYKDNIRWQCNSIRIYPVISGSATDFNICDIKPVVQEIANEFYGEILNLSKNITIATAASGVDPAGSNVVILDKTGLTMYKGTNQVLDIGELDLLSGAMGMWIGGDVYIGGSATDYDTNYNIKLDDTGNMYINATGSSTSAVISARQKYEGVGTGAGAPFYGAYGSGSNLSGLYYKIIDASYKNFNASGVCYGNIVDFEHFDGGVFNTSSTYNVLFNIDTRGSIPYTLYHYMTNWGGSDGHSFMISPFGLSSNWPFILSSNNNVLSSFICQASGSNFIGIQSQLRLYDYLSFSELNNFRITPTASVSAGSGTFDISLYSGTNSLPYDFTLTKGRLFASSVSTTTLSITSSVTVASALWLPSVGSTSFSYGNADGAGYGGVNTYLRGWWGLGFWNPTVGGTYPNQMVGYIDFREGILDMKGDLKVNGNSVWHSGEFNPANYLPLTGGTISGNLAITGTLIASGAVTCKTGLSSETTLSAATGVYTPFLYSIYGTKVLRTYAGTVQIGSGTDESSYTPFHVASSVGDTNAIFGQTNPVGLISNDPHVSFNAYYNSGWKGWTGGRTAGALQFESTLGHLSYWVNTSAIVNKGDVLTPKYLFKIYYGGCVQIGSGTDMSSKCRFHVGSGIGSAMTNAIFGSTYGNISTSFDGWSSYIGYNAYHDGAWKSYSIGSGVSSGTSGIFMYNHSQYNFFSWYVSERFNAAGVALSWNVLGRFWASGCFQVGDGTNMSAYTQFHIASSGMATNLIAGETCPISICANSPTIGYNAFYNSGWKAWTPNLYTAYSYFKTDVGTFYWNIGSSANAFNGAVTISSCATLTKDGEFSAIGNGHRLFCAYRTLSNVGNGGGVIFDLQTANGTRRTYAGVFGGIEVNGDTTWGGKITFTTVYNGNTVDYQYSRGLINRFGGWTIGNSTGSVRTTDTVDLAASSTLLSVRADADSAITNAVYIQVCAANYGIWSVAGSGLGVVGIANTGTGGYFQSTGGGYGVQAYSTATAIKGATTSGYGVYGYASGTAGYGLVGYDVLGLGHSLLANGRVVMTNITASGSAYGTLKITNTGYVYIDTSSIRFKNNIRQNPYGLSSVMQMQSSMFNWNRDGMEDIGFIAEQVNEICPHIVGKDIEGKIATLNYDRVSVLLVKAIQEQQQIIDIQKETLYNLNLKVQQMEAKLNQLLNQ